LISRLLNILLFEIRRMLFYINIYQLFLDFELNL
jgi:hypothetical protein